MPTDFNQQVIEEFRANDGRVGGYFEGARLLLLTTTGARSGAKHTTPVGYLPDGGGRNLIIATAGGSPKHPAWFHNLVANPHVTVEDGIFTYEAKATVLTGDHRDTAFARAVESDPGWADYQAKTTRIIPVVVLEQIAGGPPNASSLGAALKMIHDAFRRELGLIRKEFAESGKSLGVQLRMNCLTLCEGLSFHHTAEDTGIFPAIASRFPESAATVEQLKSEHVKIAALIAELEKAVNMQDMHLARPTVESLIEELETHLAYEEQQLIPLVDA